MKQLFTCILILAIVKTGYGQVNNTEWLNRLNKAIGQSREYDGKTLYKIDQLYQTPESQNKTELYNRYLDLFTAYSVYNFDSAYIYSKKLDNLSRQLNNDSLIAYSKLKLNFILLSSGMFKEALDSLETLSVHFLDTVQKAEYYTQMARAYYDLADYNHDLIYSPRYTQTANTYIDSSLLLYPKSSFEFNYYSGLRNIKVENFSKASGYFQTLLENHDLTRRQFAITASTLSDIYIRKRKNDSAVYLLAQAAIADLETSTKETSAILNLGTLLFKQGDFKNASQYIKKAQSDAQFYGARQRMAQLSSIVPLIEGQKLITVENERKNIFSYAVVITSIVILLTVLTAVIIFQMRKSKVQQREIKHKNISLEHMVEEKEWLLKEIHHRVKNNLQTVVSLLESQSVYLRDDALLAIQDSQNRVYSMSLIHQKLYQTENVASINMASYLPELISHLRDCFDIKQQIAFNSQIASIELDVSQAVPIGLILNEAITNCIKYAFPVKSHDQTIIIVMQQEENKKIRLSVSDNGIGLPAGFNVNTGSGLGLRLIKGLTEDLDGEFSISGEKGTMISITFTANTPLDSVNEKALPALTNTPA